MFKYVKIFVLGPLLFFATVLIQGVAISKMWAWCLVDTFGLNEITPYQAYGISLFVSFMTADITHDEGSFFYDLGRCIFVCFFFLFFGYLYHLAGGLI